MAVLIKDGNTLIPVNTGFVLQTGSSDPEINIYTINVVDLGNNRVRLELTTPSTLTGSRVFVGQVIVGTKCAIHMSSA